MTERNGQPPGDRMVDHALAYAGRGWHVFPLKPRDKMPLGALVPDGHKNATTDEAQIRAWWTSRPDAGIGINCVASGLVAVDVDSYNGGDDAFAALVEKCGPLPQTVEAATGGGGRHLLFDHPGCALRGTLGGGLDLKANGYIVAPPSLHPKNGNAYRWKDDHGPEDLRPVALPESWIAELSSGREQQTGTPDHAPSGVPLSAESREFPMHGAPLGQQRNTAVKVARAYHGAHLTLAEAQERIWQGLEASDQRSHEPWTRRESDDLVASMYEADKTPLQKRSHTFTDDGNSQRFAEKYVDEMRWVPEWKSWVFWRGDRWVRDVPEFAVLKAQELVRELYVEASTLNDSDQRKHLLNHAYKSLSAARIKAMVDLARAHPLLLARLDEFDQGSFLLNCTNGTLDLRTGELREHRREDMLTKQVTCAYVPSATSSVWQRVLDESLGEASALAAYVQRALGYALTGDTSEEKIFFFYGESGAGKGTILESFKGVLGPGYSRAVDFASLVKGAKSVGSGGSPREDIARLVGARYALVSEFERGDALAEALISNMTGRDTMTARFLYEGQFEFVPEFKLFLAANHRPRLSGSSKSGIWRRLQIVPFDHKVPQADPKVKDALTTQKAREAILAWAVQGCLQWQKDGLGTPPEVEEAVEEYKAETDELRGFVADVLLSEPGAWVAVAEVYDAYQLWTASNGIRLPMKKAKLSSELVERGFKQKTRGIVKSGGVRTTERTWVDLTLRPLGTRLKGGSS